jgi:serine protease Do
MQDVSKDLAEAFDLKTTKGVLVSSVEHDSPAEKAGLEPRDIILKYDGKDVLDSQDLTDLVSDSKVGDKVDILVNRDGSNKTVTVEVGERREPNYSGDSDLRAAPYAFQNNYRRTGIGVSLQSLTGDLGDYFGVPEGKGALITEVLKDSPAEKAGLKAGDVIVAIDGEDVEGPGDVSSIVRDKNRGDKVELSIMRDRKPEKMALEVDEINSYGWNNNQQPYIPNIPNVQIPNLNWDQFHNWNYRDYSQNNEELQNQLKDLQEKLKDLTERLKELETKVK